MASNSLKKFRYYLKSKLLWVLIPIKSGPLKGYWWSLFTGIRFLRGDYHINETEEMIRLINPDDVVYDVGAHIGYYSLIASRKVAEHYSADRRIGGSADRRIGGSADRRIGGSADRRIGGSAGTFLHLSHFRLTLKRCDFTLMPTK